jgi:putative nucleotidyltransferase with HDIG domain
MPAGRNEMNTDTIARLKEWFTQYVSGYYTGVSEDDRNIRLKEDHTHRVCRNILLLCRSLNLTQADRNLAETIALFHDLGRFEQYRKHQTFNDMKSQNHAYLGLQVMAKHRVLSGLDLSERRMLTQAIAYHNAATLPENASERSLMFMKLIRDADKLDIWKVVIDYYRERSKNPNKTIELDLPDSSECSPKALDALRQGSFARVQDMKTLNDFKLLQISWAFDLNFSKSFQILGDQRYIESIAETLPDLPEVANAIEHVFSHIRKMNVKCH